MRDAVLGVAIAAVVVASVPIAAYVWPRCPEWLNPYESKPARWTVYFGGLLALGLFIALSR